jgi:hypothetical protein
VPFFLRLVVVLLVGAQVVFTICHLSSCEKGDVGLCEMYGTQAEKKVQWQAAEGEGDFAAAQEEVKKVEEEESSSSDDEEDEISGGLLPQDLSKLDVAALTPLTPEVIRYEKYLSSLFGLAAH